MSDDLKPCPFCGGYAHLVEDHPHGDTTVRYVVACVECGARGGHYELNLNIQDAPTTINGAKWKAKTEWNRRI